MAILLVRHGETALNASLVVQPADTPLNERGLAQARLLAERLVPERPGAILCSDLPRAQMTAQPLAERTGLVPTYSAELQERNLGVHRGTPYAELGLDIFAPDYEPPQGESWARFHERTARAWLLIVQHAAQTRGDLVVITHGLVCLSLAQHQLSFPSELAAPTRWGNTSLTRIEAERPYRVQLVNCTAHLDAASADGHTRSGL